MAKSIKNKKEEVEESKPLEITPEVEALFDKEPIVSKEMEVAADRIFVPETPKPIYRKELDNTLPFEERIEAFMNSRAHNGYIGLNDFLKSLYGVPAFNTPPKWQNQGAMKQLKGLLDKMQSDGTISIEKDSHKLLGRHYYEGTQQTQSHHDLNSVQIRAKK